jgi:phospholipid/cholesterol/gamma-HCH transport system ATP-binding protein
MHSAYRIGDSIAMLYCGGILKVARPDEIRNTEDPVIRQFITGSATGPITGGQV